MLIWCTNSLPFDMIDLIREILQRTNSVMNIRCKQICEILMKHVASSLTGGRHFFSINQEQNLLPIVRKCLLQRHHITSRSTRIESVVQIPRSTSQNQLCTSVNLLSACRCSTPSLPHPPVSAILTSIESGRLMVFSCTILSGMNRRSCNPFK